ncbi:ATP-binding protein [Seleniivibrio woodruffii]|uniref:histidine kinase n=1 Tax=Seleniivibrio woodruffii TaxID=1078050 RepID=A0A4R1K6E9_9BACT|nr:ATP-binding protein [Seleniivibrio woodruffii]TCK59792.1 PAS domain-containing protein [Seleniivibrio woodruffii]TVZ35987.1 PAS domain-containing protein [Seleniivibrio woodruffii]
MKSRNIMIVESKKDATGNLEKALKGLMYGVRVIGLRSSDIAEEVKAYMPDALIVDMTVNADRNVIAKVSLIQTELSVPVIYFTEAINSRTLYQTMKTNHYGYIYTPFDEGTLQTTIELALHKFRNDTSVKESELKYRELFNNMSSGVAIYDLIEFGSKYIFTDVNNAACTLLKRDRTDLVSRPMTAVYKNAKEYGFLEALRQVQETGQPLKNEKMYYEDDVIRGWFNSYLYRLPSGSIVHIFHNITDQLEAEKQLIAKQKELELVNIELAKAVAEETDKRRKNEQIIFEQSRFMAMGQMISAIAHQWRQPLSALGINIEDLEDAYNAGELDEQYIKELTVDSMALIKTISKTMDDLSSFFRSGQEEEIFSVFRVLGEVITLQSARMKNSGVSLAFSCFAGARNLHADENNIQQVLESNDFIRLRGVPAEFKQVIINILNNAVDAIIEKESGDGRVSLKVEEAGDRLNLYITDNGCGISGDIAERMFDPYFTTKAGGSGIGLYMSKVIVEEHMNGRLTAASMPVGTVMTISLPYL